MGICSADVDKLGVSDVGVSDKRLQLEFKLELELESFKVNRNFVLSYHL